MKRLTLLYRTIPRLPLVVTVAALLLSVALNLEALAR
jgi:hypothetical protein